MSLVTYTELLGFIDQGVLTNARSELVNASSIDVELGPIIWTESTRSGTIDLAKKETPRMMRHDMGGTGDQYALAPGEFILAQTRQMFFLPDDISAEFRLKSSGARAGLDQALAVWCDPGWNSSVLTLELRNNLRYSRLLLTVGMKIGQMVFHRGESVPPEHSYAVVGQYNGDVETQPSRGVR